MATPLVSLENPVFSAFAFYSTLCILKMLAMGFLTALKRMASGTFANKEDCVSFGDKPGGKDLKPIFNNESVERVRRNHLNDLENIPAFIFLALIYVMCDPDADTAILHFRVFTAARFLHTLVYQLAIMQPSRALCHLASVGVCVSMAVRILKLANY